MVAKIDRLGRILIPKSIREKIGLWPGSAIRLEVTENAVTLSPIVEASPLIVEEGLLVYDAEPIGNMDSALEELRNERIRDLGGI